MNKFMEAGHISYELLSKLLKLPKDVKLISIFTTAFDKKCLQIEKQNTPLWF